MSLANLEEVRCPCGEVFEADLWNSINIAEDPDLKEALLSGEINIVCCPECKEIFYAEHFILFTYPENEFIAFVYPLSFCAQRDYWRKKMGDDFQRAMEKISSDDRLLYKPTLLFGMDSLVEMLHEFDEEDDEVSILKYMADELGLSLINLQPSLARQQDIPKVLPSVTIKKASLRNKILKGLEQILKHNRELLHYKKLYDIIKKDKSWTLDKKLLKPKSTSKRKVKKV